MSPEARHRRIRPRSVESALYSIGSRKGEGRVRDMKRGREWGRERVCTFSTALRGAPCLCLRARAGRPRCQVGRRGRRREGERRE
jgi:hypothetical protein